MTVTPLPPAVSPIQDEVKNPWSAEHWNISEQSRIAAISLDEARKMAREATAGLDETDPPVCTPARKDLRRPTW
jgi:hypothetical protein